jgi:hypothetical protein
MLRSESTDGFDRIVTDLKRALSNGSELVSPTSPTDSHSTNTDLDEHDLGTDQDPSESPHKSLFSGLPAVSDSTPTFRKALTETWTLDLSQKDTPFFSIMPTLKVTKGDSSTEAPNEGQEEAMKRMESAADSWLVDRKRILTHLFASLKRKSEEANTKVKPNRQREMARRKELGMEEEPWISDEQWSEVVIKHIQSSMKARSEWLKSVEKELTDVGITVDWQAGIAFKCETEGGEDVDQVEGSSSTVRPSLRRS